MKWRVTYDRFFGLRVTVGPLRLGVGHTDRGLRSYVTIGLWHASVQAQRQRPGFSLDSHVDGPEHNHCASITVRLPESGGRLEVDGDHVRLGRRVVLFDGGASYHEVTEVMGRRSRVVVLAQLASADAAHP